MTLKCTGPDALDLSLEDYEVNMLSVYVRGGGGGRTVLRQRELCVLRCLIVQAM